MIDFLFRISRVLSIILIIQVVIMLLCAAVCFVIAVRRPKYRKKFLLGMFACLITAFVGVYLADWSVLTEVPGRGEKETEEVVQADSTGFVNPCSYNNPE